jgi:glycosyltransferase involved in cell wall biosynthesis
MMQSRSSRSNAEFGPERGRTLDLSVVVPLYNEEESVVLLHRAVSQALAPLGLEYELVLVDDGSRDSTFARAAALVRADPRLRVVRLRRNFGQTAAMAAGIRHARGRVIVTMDGDLQNDPADIPRLLERLHQGYDIVAGWRRHRQDAASRVAVSKVANRIMARVMGTPVRDSGCSLKAFNADLVRGLPLYGDMHRFIPAISRLAGARIAQIEVNHRPRTLGVSKYGFSRIWKVVLDIVSIRFLLHHARRPLQRHVLLALLLFMVGFAVLYQSVLPESGTLVILGALGVLALSMGVFVAAAGFLGLLYALHERDTTCYALLAATVHAHALDEFEEQAC